MRHLDDDVPFGKLVVVLVFSAPPAGGGGVCFSEAPTRHFESVLHNRYGEKIYISSSEFRRGDEKNLQKHKKSHK